LAGTNTNDRARPVAPLKGALHTHSRCSDGELGPADVVAVYAGLGFDFVALTDHDHLMRPGCYDDLPDAENGILVFRGVELTVFEQGYFHVTKVSGEREDLHILNHPAQYALAPGRLADRIEALRKTIPIDVVEVTANGFYTPEYDVDRIPYPKVASDDSHSELGCGRAWIELVCEKDKDAIIRAIKEGQGRPCFQ